MKKSDLLYFNSKGIFVTFDVHYHTQACVGKIITYLAHTHYNLVIIIIIAVTKLYEIMQSKVAKLRSV